MCIPNISRSPTDVRRAIFFRPKPPVRLETRFPTHGSEVDIDLGEAGVFWPAKMGGKSWRKSRVVSESQHVGVNPKIGGKPPKSSILMGFSIIKHPFWGTPIFGNTHCDF